MPHPDLKPREDISQILIPYLFEHAPVLFLLADRQGSILGANRFASELVGKEVLQKNVKDIFVDFSNSIDLETFLQWPENERLLNIVTHSGLPQSLYFLFFTMGEHILLLGKPDVMELERLRKQLISLNSELNNMTRELHKKNAELAKLNALKNQFLGMAAHDLRKPIGLIMAYSEFLIDEAAPMMNQEQIGFLKTILSSTRSMRQMVDDFLDIASIESGRLQLDFQPSDLFSVIETSLASCRLQARKKQLELKVLPEDAIKDQPCRLMMDAPKIEQVIGNLVSNAIEHSTQNQTVVIKINRKDAFIVVAVTDHGSGMSQEEIPTLFKPFEKAGRKKKSGEKSAGLGLTIAGLIVKAHGGKIWIETNKGAGTTVSFSIPLNLPEKEEAHDCKRFADISRETGPTGH